MDNPAPLSQRKLIALDGVRGLAILAVMLTHIAIQQIRLAPVVRGTFALGWSGVDLFFVLSGFLITGILLDTRECSNYFRSFYARRVLRIFPLYYGFLIPALLIFPYLVSPDFMPAPGHRWFYLCYVANWLPHAQWHVLGHFWSLCVEEQFYFVWPLIVLLVSPRRLLPLVLILELLLVSGRSWWVLTPHIPTEYPTTVARVDGLLLGAACALIARQFLWSRPAKRVLPWVAGLFLAIFVAGYHALGHQARHLFTQSIGFALLAAGFAAFVLFAALTEDESGGAGRSVLRWKPLTLFGKYSYGIYVFHYPIFYLAERYSRRLPYAVHQSIWFACLLIGLESAASFLVASLSYNYFEKRFLALKDRFAPVFAEAPAGRAMAALAR